ncbi:hypothetical protein JW796_02185 [Candidatus Dojkabacteria bacterium]|nr:hypothetical protein [Candidatus Dojkabacteria bacterium]
MKNFNQNDHTNISLDSDELELLKAIDNEEINLEKPSNKRLNELSSIAKNTRVRREVVTLRLSARDVRRAKVQAKQKGLPYQSYIASVVHQELNAS